MTPLLEHAVAEAACRSDAEQDAIAARILAEIDDERAWDRAFDATTDAQWDRLAALARSGIGTPGSVSLNALIDPDRG